MPLPIDEISSPSTVTEADFTLCSTAIYVSPDRPDVQSGQGRILLILAAREYLLSASAGTIFADA